MLEKKRSVGIITLILSLCFLTPSFAETIILKTGDKIEGKIIERTDKYIKIDFSGVPIPYYFEDIESIDGERLVLSPSTSEYSNGARYYMREAPMSTELPEDFMDKADETGSVVFRVAAANPSATKTQTVPIKVYLPVEVKAEDVLDKGGLELKYDSEKSIYYLYKDDLELLPRQTMTFAVKVKDVWMIPGEEINQLRKQTTHIINQLEKTNYYAQAKEITDSIYTRLDEIVTFQNDEAVTRKQHINSYRSNVKIVAEIKEDIAKIEKFSEEVKKPPKETEKPIGFIDRIKSIFNRKNK